MDSVLVIEDNKQICDTISLALEVEGFRVTKAHDGLTGLEKARSMSPNLVILDLHLPGMRGSDVCTRIKSMSTPAPIIVLSAASAELDKVLLLELGADDYVVKPFGSRELMARVHSLLRRTRMARSRTVSLADREIDLEKGCVIKDGRREQLTALEFRLLEFFLDNPNKTLSRVAILQSVWGSDADVSLKTVDASVARLRLKIEAQPSLPRHLTAVHGAGYRFVP
jgi:DNA-binding response OmpR family regulator